MAYISFVFYSFIIALLVIYYTLPLRYRWCALLLADLVFYWYISQYSFFRFSFLIMLSFTSYIFGLISKKYIKYGKLITVISVIITASSLIFIKYYTFLLRRDNPAWLLIPVGLSFYSLQLISYNIDVYKDRILPERNFFRFLLFASFFPQIIQGPIPRYSQLADQLYNGHRFDEDKFTKGFMLIIWGFFLKLCIADKAGVVVNCVFDNYPTYKGVYVIVAGVLYSIQLYTDFMACTTLAQGISELFGIDLINNFNHPYLSSSVKEFWRRWHISLTSWLRDYIYIPLGGNRKGKIRKYLNILITYAVSGIWHGVGFKYLFWGLLHGTYQVVGDSLEIAKNTIRDRFNISEDNRLILFLKRVITFVLVMLGWIIFRADHLTTGLSMIGSIIKVRNPWVITNDVLFSLGLELKEWVILILCMLILGIVSILQERGFVIRDHIQNESLPVRWGLYIGVIVFIMLFGTYGYGYDAQTFIYGGF